MKLTLLNAIRRLKPGEAIPEPNRDVRFWNPFLMRWDKGLENPIGGRVDPCDWDREVSIIDLPEPKMTLEESLFDAHVRLSGISPTDVMFKAFCARMANRVRKTIDWQAEIDRKKEEKEDVFC